MTDQRRRRWSTQERAALVRRTYEPGMSVSLAARQEGVSASLLFQWRKLERKGALTAVLSRRQSLRTYQHYLLRFMIANGI